MMMEWVWESQEQNHQEELLQLRIDHDQQNPNGVAGLYVKVMTDEQMELLRRQISVYATLCEQLVEMHRAITAHQDPSGVGTRVGNLYCDSLMVSGGHKMGSRQRWTPTPLQLQILEQMFDEGNGTPNKLKVKEITIELAQHGQISETNVYNWFQNRRARSKKKHLIPPPNNVESEAEAEARVESLKEHDSSKAENIQLHDENENVYFLRAEIDDTEFTDSAAIFHQFGSFEPYTKTMM